MSKNILQYAMGLLIIAFLCFAQNASAVTEIDSDINSPTIWYKKDSPHVVIGGINVNAPLTIEAGAIVKFSNKIVDHSVGALKINSTFIAIGSELDKIIFTSTSDSNYGGDTSIYSMFSRNYPIRGDWSGIVLYENPGSIHIENAILSYASTAIKYQSVYKEYYDGLTVKNSEIVNNTKGIYLRNVKAKLENISIHDNNTGIEVFTPSKNAQISSIRNSAIYNNGAGVRMDAFYVYQRGFFDARYNWWGDASGPYYKRYYPITQEADNIDGLGNRVDDGVFFTPWLQKDTTVEEPACQENCYSNVLFLPGLKASRLYSDTDSTCPYDGDNKKIAWEPNCNEDVLELFLDDEGKSSNPNIVTKEGNIIDETPIGSNIYKSFIEKMNSMRDVDGVINDWKPVAYDWRLSLEDILADGSIERTLRDLAVESKTKKVTIVAHSNGGLLAKALMQKLGDEEGEALVDKIIFVAVPQVGTPAAVAGLLHGEGQGFFPVLSTKTARGFGENMPGAYNLLPSDKYFSTVFTPVVSFDIDSNSDLNSRYTEDINSGNKLSEFLMDDFRRVSATNSEVDIPARLNWNLFQKSKNLHESLDSWNAPEEIKIIQIAGWGVDTLSETKYESEKVKYCDEGICASGVDVLTPDFDFTIDGDETVVTPSALWMGDDERYFVNMRDYNKNNPFETLLGFASKKHANILEIPELNSFIADNITDNVKPISEYKYFYVDTPPSSNEKRLQYSLHSPLTLELYDNEGRLTGINFDGQIEEQITGTYYKQFGDVKYIFADEDISSHIEMYGYDIGTFTFTVKEFIGDKEVNKITFKDMPVTPETKVNFAIPANFESASNLEIDKDGDGTIDFSIEPKIGEVVIFDNNPPTTNNSMEGTQGDNNWYISDVKLLLSATDEAGGSGIAKTKYSLDNGKTWTEYMNPILFDQEGIFEIKYFSTDNNGNVEEAKEVKIKIDKTAPEAELIFNAQIQKLDIVGIDNLSKSIPVVVKESTIDDSVEEEKKNNKHIFWFSQKLKKENEKKIITTATLIDEAGHKTELIWEKKKDKNHRIDLAVSSIAYDGDIIPIAANKMQYKWAQNWKEDKYLFLASYLSASATSIETHYFPNKNETWLMEKPAVLADEDNDNDFKKRPIWKKMTGMIIPSIITEKGNTKIDY